MADLGRKMDLEWTTVTKNRSRMRDDARGTITTTYSFVYSTSGPPYVELIESATESMWSTDTPYLHHLGVWTRDLVADSDQFEAEGWHRAAHGIDDDGQIARFAFHSTGYGPMIELLAPDLQPALERWIAGGELLPTPPT